MMFYWTIIELNGDVNYIINGNIIGPGDLPAMELSRVWSTSTYAARG